MTTEQYGHQQSHTHDDVVLLEPRGGLDLIRGEKKTTVAFFLFHVGVPGTRLISIQFPFCTDPFCCAWVALGSSQASIPHHWSYLREPSEPV